MRISGLLLLSVGLLAACVSKPPIVEYTLARSALDNAERVEANKYSPNNWQRAKEAFEKAQRELSDTDNDEARKSFIKARQWAEKAENQTRYNRFKQGEGT